MKNILYSIIIIYQKIIAPLLHQLLGIKDVCRSTPSCSVYTKNSISQYGIGKGVALSLRHVLNCQPFFSI